MSKAIIPRASLTYFNDGGGGGGGPSDFFGSEILAKSDLFGFMKDAGFFLGCKKRTKGLFWGMLNKAVIFLGRQILKL